MNKNRRRLMSLLMAAVMILSLGSPAARAEKGSNNGAPVGQQTSQPTIVHDMDPASLNVKKLGSDLLPEKQAEKKDKLLPGDIVRVSIFLDEKSTMDAGYPMENIASNEAAQTYRQQLAEGQHNIEDIIREVTGRELTVYWNLTLLVNAISADVRYGDIPRIETIKGVKSVELEAYFQAPEPVDEEATPQTAFTTDGMISANLAWNSGYSGAGSKISIVDTGIDVEHISFDEGAFLYAINELREQGQEITLMTEADIPANGILNRNDGRYVSAKIPYALNYAQSGGNVNIDHRQPKVGNHGSHVAGIAAGNRYVPKDDTYVSSIDEYGAIGVAPEAQIILMKVFDGGGAWVSGYMAAIEDSILLGCDSCNLSLGSSSPGFTWPTGSSNSENKTDSYLELFEKLTTDANPNMVVTISAGNNGPLVQNLGKDMYIDNIYQHTGGSPGTYLSSLNVASADNIGRTYHPLLFDGQTGVLFVEAVSVNGGITAQPGTMDYVYLESFGTPEDYEAINAAVPLAGKMVIVNRGGNISFVDKANDLIPYNPGALIIANNTRGTVSMGLSDFEGFFSILSISVSDARSIKAGAPVSGAVGSIDYYTGSLTIQSGTVDRDNARMSSFSSWGVPGSLLMKPEITAPGGQINAAFGYDEEDATTLNPAHKVFGLKGGTSMAAPHVAGLSALVGQQLRENPMADRNSALSSAYSNRAIMQSLMMSTATPMILDNRYISLLNQGAGLIHAQRAVEASSVIMIDEAYLTSELRSHLDGKVKVELGDDPERQGSYRFTATLYNTSDEVLHFNTDVKLFTQARYQHNGQTYMDLLTSDLNGITQSFEWEYIAGDIDSHDVNQDGVTDPKDAQALLDYLTGNRPADELNLDAGEMDNDGLISTYDAHLLLNYLEEQADYADGEIPAHGKRSVSVNFSLPAALKAQLKENYPAGNYLEGFVYFSCDTETAEGIQIADEHTVPVLGFFGNWTDPSMFDNTSYTDVLYGTDTREPYLASKETNYLTVNYGEEAVLFTGNPYMVEESFPSDRLAVNSETVLESLTYSLLRAAGTTGWAVSRLTEPGGSIDQVIDSSRKALQYGVYYDSGTKALTNLSPIEWSIGGKAGSYNLAEGDCFRVGMYAFPELTGIKMGLATGGDFTRYNYGYLSSQNFVNLLEDEAYDSLIGTGAWFGYDFVVDNTAPVLEDPILMGSNLNLSVTDNQNIAYIALLSLDGTITYLEMAPGSAGFDGALDISGFMDDVEGYVALIIADYAGNETAKAVKINNNGGGNPFEASSVTVTPESVTFLVGGELDLTYTMAPMTVEDTSVTWSSSDNNVVTVDQDGHIVAVGLGEAVVTATANNNPAVSGSCQVIVKAPDRVLNGIAKHEDGSVYFVSFNVNNPAALTNLSDTDFRSYDLRGALVYEDGTLYVNSMTSNRSKVYTVDTDSFSLTELSPVSANFGANGIARGLSGGDAYGSMAFPYGSSLFLGNLTSSTRDIGVAVISVGISGGYGVGVAAREVGPTAASFYYLVSDGAIWTVDVKMNGGTRSFGTPTKVMDTDLTSSYGAGDLVYHGQALYYDGEFLYWSHAMEDGSGSLLLAIDPVNAICYELGYFDEDIVSVVALYEDGIAAPADKVVSSVSLDPRKITLTEGESQTINATVVHGQAEDTSLIWSSSDTEIATVDQNGLVIAVAEGTAIISAASAANSGAVGRCEVRVISQGTDPNAVTELILNTNTANLLIGAEVSLTATVLPEEAEDKSVSWSSDASAVVSVDANGKLVALAPGTAVITAASNADPTISASCTVTVKAASQGFRAIVRSEEGTYFSYFNLEDLSQVTKLHTDDKASMQLRSAMIAHDGTLYAGSGGNSTTLYTVDPDAFTTHEYSSAFTAVNGMARGLQGYNYTDMMFAYFVYARGGNINPAYGSSANPNKSAINYLSKAGSSPFVGVAGKQASNTIAESYFLDTDGTIWLVTINRPGGTGSAAMDNLVKVLETGIPVEYKNGSTPDYGYAKPYNSQALYYDGEFLYWTHGLADGSVELIVIDPESGLFYTLGTFAEGVHAVMGIYTHGDVAPVAVTEVNIIPASLTLEAGNAASLAVTVLPANANDKSVTWHSSDNDVVTVDGNGNIMAVAEGTAQVYAVSNSNPAIQGACQVTVTAATAPIPVNSVSLNYEAVTLLAGGNVSLTATVAPESAEDKSLSWTSSNTAVAAVVNGQVSAVAAGTAVITATAVSNPNASASCTITVKAADLTLHGIVRSDDGTFFSEFNIGDLTAVTPLHTDDKTEQMLKSAFVTNDGTLYAGSIDANGNATNLYAVDISDYSLAEPVTNYYGANDTARAFTNYAYVDMAYVRGRNFYAGNIDTSKGSGKSGYPWMGTSSLSPNIVVENSDGKYFVGIAEKVTNATTASYYLLDQAGSIWEVTMVRSGSATFANPPLVKILETQIPVATNTGYGFGSTYQAQSIFYDGELLYWVRGSKTGLAELIVIDPVSGVFNNMGSFAEGIHSITGLYNPADLPAASGNSVQKLPDHLKGYLASAQVREKTPDIRRAAAQEAASATQGKAYEITEDVPVTNGLLEITYNPAETALLTAESSLEYHSIYEDKENGIIRFAYAGKNPLETNEVFLLLEFAHCEDAEVEIKTRERNNTLDISNETASISWEGEGHAWGEATYEWTPKEGCGYSVTAARICTLDENHVDTETVDATYEVIAPPYGSNPGKGRYTAEFTKEGFAAQTRDESFEGEPVRISFSISMRENFDLNMYFRNIDPADAELYTVRWTFDGDREPAEQEQNLGNLTQDSQGRYKLVLGEVYSFQMTHLFHIFVEYNGRVFRSFDYSVQKCLEALFENNEEDREVSRAALNYGAAAQAYFEGRQYKEGEDVYLHHTNLPDYVANEKLSEDEKQILAAKPDNAVATAGALSGLSKRSVSLILGTRISIKLYFRYTGDITDLSFSANYGKTISEPVQEADGRYSVELGGISSYELHKDYVITITKGEESSSLTYSPYTYAAKNWDSADALTANLCRSLVDFGEAARLRWPEN